MESKRLLDLLGVEMKGVVPGHPLEHSPHQENTFYALGRSKDGSMYELLFFQPDGHVYVVSFKDVSILCAFVEDLGNMLDTATEIPVVKPENPPDAN